MELYTYSDLWRAQRRIHAIQDIPLPRPVAAKQLVVALGVAVAWIASLAAVGIPQAIAAGLDTYHTGVNVVVLGGPPVAAAWLVGRPLRHHLTGWQLAVSLARYLLSPRWLHRLGETGEPDELAVTAAVWIARPPNTRPRSLAATATVAVAVAATLLVLGWFVADAVEILSQRAGLPGGLP
jgi:ferric-dicitrate binding protein FerR (iron transport regulator)